MFPHWEDEVEDTAADNIIKVMYERRPWKWTQACWEVKGTWVPTKPVKEEKPVKAGIAAAKEESPRPRKKPRKESSVEVTEKSSEEVPTEAKSEATTSLGGMTKADFDRLFMDVCDGMRDGFGVLHQEMKYMSEKMEGMEERMEGIEQRMEGMEQRMGGMEKKMEAMEKRMEGVEKKVGKALQLKTTSPAHEPGVSKAQPSPTKKFTRQRKKK